MIDHLQYILMLNYYRWLAPRPRFNDNWYTTRDTKLMRRYMRYLSAVPTRTHLINPGSANHKAFNYVYWGSWFIGLFVPAVFLVNLCFILIILLDLIWSAYALWRWSKFMDVVYSEPIHGVFIHLLKATEREEVLREGHFHLLNVLVGVYGVVHHSMEESRKRTEQHRADMARTHSIIKKIIFPFGSK